MSFFKSFKNSYTPISQDDGLPTPVTQPSNTGFRLKLLSLNPFKSDSIQLEDDNNVPSGGFIELSQWDRMLIFGLTFAGSVSCYMICIFLFPVLSLKPRKFALLWSLGSIFFLVSFGVLQGFKPYVTHLFSSTRIVFSIIFITSIIMTLISSLSLRSTLLSIVFAVVQLISAVWYTVSYFPMGQQTLNLASNVARSQVVSWVNS